jgi:TP901 family phage tail tape measure protein
MGLEGTSVGSIYGHLKLEWSSFQTSMAQVHTQLGAIGEAFKKVGQQWITVGRSLTTTLTVPIALLGVSAAKTFTDFKLSMSRIEGLVGLSKDAVDELGDAVKKLAPAVGRGPKELADALYYITSAGIPASQAMGVLEVSAKAAAAGLGQTQVVADAVTSAMNAYSSTGMTAAKATDILTAAVKYGKLEADSLAPVLGQVISVASTLGISFDQVAGSMAAMSRTGVDASQSATALTAIMSMLLKPTTQGTELLEAQGLSYKGLRDMAAQPGGLIEVLRTLDATFEGNDEAMATLVPNIRALRGVLNLLTQNAGTVNEVLQGVTNSTGALDLAFQAYTDTAKFKLDAAMTTLKTTLIDVGEVVMPMVTVAAVAVTEALKAFSTWWTTLDEDQQKFIVKVALVVAAIGPLLVILGTAFKTIGNLGSAFTALTSPVNLIIIGIAAVVATLIYLHKNWTEIWEKMSTSQNPWIRGIAAAIEAIGIAIKGVITFVINLIDWFKRLVDAAKAALSTVGVSQGMGAGGPSGPGTGGTPVVEALPLGWHANGGYFTTPHIAAIAEAGPEWIVPENRAAEFAGRMGAMPVNVTYNITAADNAGIRNELRQHDKELLTMLRGGRW